MKVKYNSIGSDGCDPLCGGRKPHDPNSCEPYTWVKGAKCIEIKEKEIINF